MISRLSSFLTSLMLKRAEEKEEQYREVYRYVFFIILNYVWFFVYSTILGALLGIPFQSIVFFISIAVLRRYAGGYHADTETACLIISSLYFGIGIVFIKLITAGTVELNLFFPVAVTVCSIIIALLCPCEAPEKPLEEKQLRVMKIKSIITVLVLLAVISVLWAVEKKTLAAPFISCIFTEAVLLVAGKIKFRKRKTETSNSVI